MDIQRIEIQKYENNLMINFRLSFVPSSILILVHYDVMSSEMKLQIWKVSYVKAREFDKILYIFWCKGSWNLRNALFSTLHGFAPKLISAGGGM